MMISCDRLELLLYSNSLAATSREKKVLFSGEDNKAPHNPLTDGRDCPNYDAAQWTA